MRAGTSTWNKALVGLLFLFDDKVFPGLRVRVAQGERMYYPRKGGAVTFCQKPFRARAKESSERVQPTNQDVGHP